MNKVKRAIIMAAGKGERLRPVTETTPKPMIKVNGVRMIDTIIDALHANGVNEIHIVTGYLGEKFSELKEKYPDIDLINNPLYDECNNISSLYVARDYLEDVVILDGDQIIYNQDILKTEFEISGYNAIYTEKETDEWLMQVDDENIVTSCSRTGGTKGWQLFSISRWTAEDGKKLKKYLEYEFDEVDNRQIYWDDVAMFCHFDDFTLGIHPMKKGDIIEVDNFNELILLDESYNSYQQI